MFISDYVMWSKSRWVPPHLPGNSEGLTDQLVMALGLVGECGEVAEVVERWAVLGTHSHDDLEKELGDVIYYWARLCSEFGYLPVMAGGPLASGEALAFSGTELVLSTLRLTVAAGAIAEVFKKHVRDANLDRRKLDQALGNVLNAWAELCEGAGLPWQQVMDTNRDKIDGRAERGTTRGSGNYR